jgi:hypothetical protein
VREVIAWDIVTPQTPTAGSAVRLVTASGHRSRNRTGVPNQVPFV